MPHCLTERLHSEPVYLSHEVTSNRFVVWEGGVQKEVGLLIHCDLGGNGCQAGNGIGGK